MFALAVLFAVLCVATAHMNPFFPKEWHDVKVSMNSTAVTSYLITSVFSSSNTCSGEAETVSGMGFGACIVGSDACGNTVSAMNYVFNKFEKNTVYYTYNSFKGGDCSTTPIASYALQSKVGCLNAGTAGYGYDYVEGEAATNSWKGRNKGIVSEVYYGAGCNSNPAFWSALSYNYCFASGATCENPTSNKYAKYTACSGNQATIGYFSDAKCSSALNSETFPPINCAKNAGLDVYTTNVCNV